MLQLLRASSLTLMISGPALLTTSGSKGQAGISSTPLLYHMVGPSLTPSDAQYLLTCTPSTRASSFVCPVLASQSIAAGEKGHLTCSYDSSHLLFRLLQVCVWGVGNSSLHTCYLTMSRLITAAYLHLPKLQAFSMLINR